MLKILTRCVISYLSNYFFLDNMFTSARREYYMETDIIFKKKKKKKKKDERAGKMIGPPSLEEIIITKIGKK